MFKNKRKSLKLQIFKINSWMRPLQMWGSTVLFHLSFFHMSSFLFVYSPHFVFVFHSMHCLYFDPVWLVNKFLIWTHQISSDCMHCGVPWLLQKLIMSLSQRYNRTYNTVAESYPCDHAWTEPLHPLAIPLWLLQTGQRDSSQDPSATHQWRRGTALTSRWPPALPLSCSRVFTHCPSQ